VGKDIPSDGGNIHVRIYTPITGKAPYPVIVYYHGCGFVIANLDEYDASATYLPMKQALLWYRWLIV
jgi:acetyl esterase